MSYSALGQLGGAWGWYSLWKTGPAGPRDRFFAAWMWTDHGTAQFISRRASGVLPSSGSRQFDYMVDSKAASGSRTDLDYKWREMLAGPWFGEFGKRSPHTSWIYTTAQGASDINFQALQDSAGEFCRQDRYCFEVRDVRGNLIT